MQTTLDDLEVVPDFNTCHGQPLPLPSRTRLWMLPHVRTAPTDAHALRERPPPVATI